MQFSQTHTELYLYIDSIARTWWNEVELVERVFEFVLEKR